MDSTKTTPPVSAVLDSVKLGEGSFGKVFASKAGNINSATKHVKLNFEQDDLPYIHESTLREYAVLAQCGGGYIPKLTKAAKFDISKDKLELTMTNGGMTLLSYANTIPYIERIKFVPSLIYQLAQGLLQLKNSGVLHGDVKPDNILVDPKTKRVRIIDFGISTFIQKDASGPFYIDFGTYLYCPFETFDKNHAYNTSSVWNIVMSVWDFLYKGYGGMERFVWDKTPAWSYSKKNLKIDEKVREIFNYLNQQVLSTANSKIDISENQAFDDVKKVFPSVYKLVCKMVDMNPESRISLEEICSSDLLLSIHKPLYVRLPKLRTSDVVVAQGWKSNQDQRESQINSLITTANMFSGKRYVPLAVLLMDLYLSKVAIAKEKLYLAGLSCLSIAIALSDNCEYLYDNLNSSVFRPYSLKDLFKMNVHIVQTLKGRLYYKTFIHDIIEKHSVVNYDVANRAILATSAPYDNQVLLQMYSDMCYAKY